MKGLFRERARKEGFVDRASYKKHAVCIKVNRYGYSDALLLLNKQLLTRLHKPISIWNVKVISILSYLNTAPSSPAFLYTPAEVLAAASHGSQVLDGTCTKSREPHATIKLEKGNHTAVGYFWQ